MKFLLRVSELGRNYTNENTYGTTKTLKKLWKIVRKYVKLQGMMKTRKELGNLQIIWKLTVNNKLFS